VNGAGEKKQAMGGIFISYRRENSVGMNNVPLATTNTKGTG
jgi:hypothetical protein